MVDKKTSVLETYSLVLIDMLAVIISFLIAKFLRFSAYGKGQTNIEREYLVCVIVLIISILYGVFTDYNREFFKRGSFIEFVAVIKYVFLLMIMFGATVFFVKAKEFSRLLFLYFGIFDFLFTYLFHISFKHIVLNTYSKMGIAEKVLIVTDTKTSKELLKNIEKNKEWNYDITSIALLDIESKPKRAKKINGIPVVAGKSDLLDVATVMPLDAVFISVEEENLSEIRELIEQFEIMGITCHYNVEKKELKLEGKTAGNFAGYTVMTFSLNYRDYRRLLIKRVIDIFGAIIGLIITGILTPFVALFIKIESKGPVFFSQERVGKNGRRFRIYKFRSMYADAEDRKKELMEENEMKGLMFKMEDDPRITKVGKFIRKTSIDELPQFYNVLKGDMSLVGTRPPTVDEFEKYNTYYRRRLSITPGLTGMWQVSGRNDIDDFDEVVKLDLEYIENWSLLLDMKIIFMTIGVVVFHKGAK